MKAYEKLNEGYSEIYSIDLKKNKKLSLLVNGLAILIMVALVVPMKYIVPIYPVFNIGSKTVVIFIIFALLFLYTIFHELVHGVAMKICGTKKVKYGFTGLYAFAGSDDYYDKKAHRFIALAPVVLWGVVLAVINVLVPIEWFWIVYIVQVANLSGAAGDLFVTVKFLKLPKDILIKDYGVGMTVFSKTKN